MLICEPYTLLPGVKVTYSDGFKVERGIVKSIPKNDDEHVFVVYSKIQSWLEEQWPNLTGQRTRRSSLSNGWGRPETNPTRKRIRKDPRYNFIKII